MSGLLTQIGTEVADGFMNGAVDTKVRFPVPFMVKDR